MISRLLCLSIHSLAPKSFFRMISSNVFIPTLPRGTLTSFGKEMIASVEAELDVLHDAVASDDESRDSIFRQNSQILFAIRTGDIKDLDGLVGENSGLISTILESSSVNELSRGGGHLGQAIREFTEARLLQHFFLTGQIAPVSMMQPCNDEEYIGAVLGFAQELSRYVIGRAGEGDVQSIEHCRKLVEQLNGKMLEFNFRNTYIRRKYDGLKYALRTIENTAYELSLLDIDDKGDVGAELGDTAREDSDSKRRRIEEPKNIADTFALSSAPGAGAGAGAGASAAKGGVDELVTGGGGEAMVSHGDPPAGSSALLVDFSELEAIRLRMEEFDALREDVIKQSRDVQKLSKQAIFSVQRNALADAEAKLGRARAHAVTIMQLVAKNPTLRPGAFSNSLEEWAEGMLALEWAKNKRLLGKKELQLVDTFEYVGALSDFTGEVGRMAVAAATHRDLDSVQQIIQVDVVVLHMIMLLNTGNKFTKKYEAAVTNLKKAEDVLYDLRLLSMGGRARRTREPDAPPKDSARDEEEEDGK